MSRQFQRVSLPLLTSAWARVSRAVLVVSLTLQLRATAFLEGLLRVVVWPPRARLCAVIGRRYVRW